ncbi:MAG: hypothetical protein IT337_15180 [Thermomicrobiales bacterium]|nr:hypothetical protein [Thermomicrobiales bacterium]
MNNARVKAGAEFNSDAEVPGRTWVPLDDEARARIDALPPERRASRLGIRARGMRARAERAAAGAPSTTQAKTDAKPNTKRPGRKGAAAGATDGEQE